MNETVPCQDTVSKDNSAVDTFYVKRDRIEKRLLSLAERNKVLARFIYLHVVQLWPNEISGEVIKKLQPKRGPKPDLEISVQLIMKVLGCSCRTALDYKAAFDIEKQAEKLDWLSMSAAAEKRSEQEAS